MKNFLPVLFGLMWTLTVSAQESSPLQTSETPSETESPSENTSLPEALKAFVPEEWSSTQLKAEPNEASSNLRLVQASDQIRVLRSQGEWYEVDLITASGLEFRGWLKGSLPTELKPQERQISITQAPVEEGPSPLESTKYRWFWSRDWDERGFFSLSAGAQNIKFSLNGINPSDERVDIPGYNFLGFGLGLNTRFGLMETQIKKFPWRVSAEAQYLFGFFQVRFANNFNPIEVAGDAYRIQTHKIHAQIWNESFFELGENFRIKPGLGLGYFYFESAPDLRRTPTGNVVFTQMGIHAMSTTLRTELQWKEKFRVQPWWTFLILPKVFESPNSYSGNAANSTSIKLAGLPLILGADFEYKVSNTLGLELQTSYLSFKAKHKGPSQRIDVEYEDLNISFSQLGALFGLKFYY